MGRKLTFGSFPEYGTAPSSEMQANFNSNIEKGTNSNIFYTKYTWELDMVLYLEIFGYPFPSSISCQDRGIEFQCTKATMEWPPMHNPLFLIRTLSKIQHTVGIWTRHATFVRGTSESHAQSNARSLACLCAAKSNAIWSVCCVCNSYQ